MSEQMDDELSLLTLESLPQAFAELGAVLLATTESQQEAALEFAALLDVAGGQAVTKGWVGLLEVCSLVAERLETLAVQSEALSSSVLGACVDWAGLLQHYLDAPQDTAASRALVEFVCRPCWALAIEPDHATEIEQMLNLVAMDEAESDELLSAAFGGDGEASPLLSEGEPGTLDLMAAFAEDTNLEDLRCFADEEAISQDVDEPGAIAELQDTAEVESARIVGSEPGEDIDPAWAALDSLLDDESSESTEPADPQAASELGDNTETNALEMEASSEDADLEGLASFAEDEELIPGADELSATVELENTADLETAAELESAEPVPSEQDEAVDPAWTALESLLDDESSESTEPADPQAGSDLGDDTETSALELAALAEDADLEDLASCAADEELSQGIDELRATAELENPAEIEGTAPVASEQGEDVDPAWTALESLLDDEPVDLQAESELGEDTEANDLEVTAFAEDADLEDLADFAEDEEVGLDADEPSATAELENIAPLASEQGEDLDPAWIALESLLDDEPGVSAELSDPQGDSEPVDDTETGGFEDALELMAADISADTLNTEALLDSLVADDSTSSVLDSTSDVSMTDLALLLEPEEEEDGLAAFADELVADELALASTQSGDGELSENVSQLLSILVAELPQIDVAFREWLGLLASDVDEGIQLEACSTAQELLGRLQIASESMGLQGLSQVCECAMTNLAQIDGTEDQSHWVQVLLLLRSYLNDPLNTDIADNLVAFLSDRRLPAPMAEPQALILAETLAQPDFSLFEDEDIDRLQEASAEHVSLAVGDDVSPELFDGLLQELPQFCEQFSLAVQRLIIGGSMDDVIEAQRVAHTIKGAGNVVGIRGVAELTHHLEDILIVLAKHESLPASGLAETMIKASDCLESMSDALQGFSSAPSNAQQVLQEVLDWANLIDREGPPDADSTTDLALPGSGTVPEEVLVAQPVASVSSELVPAAAIISAPAATPVVESAASTTASTGAAPQSPAEAGDVRSVKSESATLRVSADLVDDLLRLVGEATILNAQLRERVQQTQDRAQLLEAQFDAIHLLGTELEELVDIKDFSSQRDVDHDFDVLEMDQYNELHSYSRRMIEAAVDAKEMGQEILGELDTLGDMVVNQGQINSETHEGVLKTRMVPVDSVFARLQRCVRQTCRTTGKQVELILTGGETMMDSEVLRDVVDPVMHLLRNAVDHGIEEADRRARAGKSASGKLELSFSRDGNHILVRCQDDGAGLDYEAIRVAAVRDGLLDKDADIGEDELKRMVLRPNFTTRGTVTQVSGRGIGLNAVYGQVIGLKGSLQLDSTRGQGCTMDIRLPVTLLSTHALLVRVDKQTYALASRGIERIVYAEDGEFAFFGGELVYRLDKRPYRVRRLANVLGLEAEVVDGAPQAGSVILMEIDDRVEAVVVDEVVGSRELVVKTLGQYMPKLTGIVGATILGDGQVSPVLDLVEMLRQPVAFEQHSINEYGRMSSEALSNKPVAMVVDDSLSARRALAQLLTDAGYEVKTARDGMEAVDLLSTVRPDIMFVDMEMPRMNGIELTSHLRSRGGFDQLPVVMITSRSTEKHRRQATEAGVDLYLTKPFSDDQLIAQIEYLTGSFA